MRTDTDKKNKTKIVIAVITNICTVLVAIIGTYGVMNAKSTPAVNNNNNMIVLPDGQQINLEEYNELVANYRSLQEKLDTLEKEPSPPRDETKQESSNRTTQHVAATPLIGCPVAEEWKEGGSANFAKFEGDSMFDQSNQLHSNGIIFSLGYYPPPSLYRIYQLDGKFTVLSGLFAETYASRSSEVQATLYIIDDDTKKQLFASRIHTHGTDPESVEVDVSGVRRLRVFVRGDSIELYSSAEFGFFDVVLA